jgi:transcriptional regulator with XRE-family HTH domain
MITRMTVTPSQSRAARGLVEWSQAKLANAAGISISTIRDFETGRRSPLSENLELIRRALEHAGVEFYADQGSQGEVGVILRKSASTKSFPRERMNVKCMLLHGMILKAYSTIEFVLTDLCGKCVSLKDYKKVPRRRTSSFLANVKLIRQLTSLPGPLKHYSAPLQRLIDEAVRLSELRSFIVHGVSAVSEAKVVYKKHRDHSDGEGISEIEIDFEQLKTTADSMDRISKELTELIATISKDRRFA